MELILSTNYTTTIKLTRLIEKRLQPVGLDISLDLELDSTASPDVQVYRLNLMKKWMEDILSNCVAFHIHNPIDTDFLANLENFIMFCPDEPNDYLLLLLVVAKLNAIGAGIIEVKTAGIVGDTSQGFGYTLIGDPNEVLVSDEEWMGSPRYYDKAWWNRPDGSMMDVPMDENDDPEKKPDILINLDNDFKPTPVKVVAEKSTTEDDSGAEIIKLNFKPTIVPND